MLVKVKNKHAAAVVLYWGPRKPLVAIHYSIIILFLFLFFNNNSWC